MEGITGFIFREAHHAVFSGIDRYFTPFIAPNSSGTLKKKERDDILPEHNKGMVLIPQILTNHADHFLACEKTIRQYGYQELNINLGCPSRTVASKGRGAGFLGYPEELRRFLDEIFSRTECDISIKTRIGIESPEEFEQLIQIYNSFPIKELIVHPRTLTMQYKGLADWDAYEMAVQKSEIKLSYNGDITDKEIYDRFCKRFPDTEAVMIGRGLLTNPGLADYLKNDQQTTLASVRQFHDRILEGYINYMPNDTVVLFKMKELWAYQRLLFTDSRSYAKKIRKAKTLNRYMESVDLLFMEQVIAV